MDIHTRVVLAFRHASARVNWLLLRPGLKPVLLLYESAEHSADYKLFVGSYESVAHAERARAFDLLTHDERVANLYTISSPTVKS